MGTRYGGLRRDVFQGFGGMVYNVRRGLLVLFLFFWGGGGRRGLRLKKIGTGG